MIGLYEPCAKKIFHFFLRQISKSIVMLYLFHIIHLVFIMLLKQHFFQMLDLLPF